MANGKITAKFVGPWESGDILEVTTNLNGLVDVVKPDKPTALLLVRGDSVCNFGLLRRRALMANRGGWPVVVVTKNELSDERQRETLESEYGVTIIEGIGDPKAFCRSFEIFIEKIQRLCGAPIAADRGPQFGYKGIL